MYNAAAILRVTVASEADSSTNVQSLDLLASVNNVSRSRCYLLLFFNPRHPHAPTPHVCKQLTIKYYQRKRGTKRMVGMHFDFTELCTTIPPLEYGGNEVLLDAFASKVQMFDASDRSSILTTVHDLDLSRQIDPCLLYTSPSPRD